MRLTFILKLHKLSELVSKLLTRITYVSDKTCIETELIVIQSYINNLIDEWRDK